MKKRLLPFFPIAAVLLTLQSFSQRNTAFAVTAATKGTFNWNVIREIDLSTGELIRTLYDPMVNKAINYRAVAGAEIGNNAVTGSALGASVAAAAYDALHNRLYFTNMRGNSLLYIDLATKDLNVVVNNSPTFNTGNKNDEANVITRMAFAADGFGYALTNDGKGFLRFTTDQKPAVTNLGELIDGSKNGTNSVHSQCSNWGGDIVGDAYGNLYLVTYRNYVFKINPVTRITDYLGQIKGLPSDFTSNGVVVDRDGDMIVTSATQTNNYYKVNISTLDATEVRKKEAQVFNSSDLANENLLYQQPATQKLVTREVRGDQQISLYPNPAPNRTFSLQFDKVAPGRYNLVLSDASGRAVLAKAITIAVSGQVERFSLPRTTAAGMYMIKLVGGDKKSVFNNKLVFQ